MPFSLNNSIGRQANFSLVSARLQAMQRPAPVRQRPLFSPQDLFVGRTKSQAGAIPAVAAPLSKPAAPAAHGTPHAARGTGYYPFNNRMEGGYKDMKSQPLHTLQDFLNGKAAYVSIALDKDLYEHVILAGREKYRKTGDPRYKKYLTLQPQVRYGDTFRIPELDAKYGRPIVFKAVDTGGAFTGKGFGRVDICTASSKDSRDATINGKLTLVKL